MDYIAINNYNRLGEMGISRQAIRTIAYNAVTNVPGAAIYAKPGKKQGKGKKNDAIVSDLFSIADAIDVHLDKSGKARIHIEVEVKEGTNATEIAKAIQKEVGESLAMMCDTMPYEVTIRIARVVA